MAHYNPHSRLNNKRLHPNSRTRYPSVSGVCSQCEELYHPYIPTPPRLLGRVPGMTVFTMTMTDRRILRKDKLKQKEKAPAPFIVARVRETNKSVVVGFA